MQYDLPPSPVLLPFFIILYIHIYTFDLKLISLMAKWKILIKLKKLRENDIFSF